MSIIINLLESFGYTWFLTHYLNKNERYNKFYAILLCTLSFLTLENNILFENLKDISIILISIFGLIYACYCFSNNILEILFSLCFIESLILGTNVFTIMSFSIFSLMTPPELLTNETWVIMIALSTKIIFLILAYILPKLKKHHYMTSSRSMIYLLITYILTYTITAILFSLYMQKQLYFPYIEVVLLLYSCIFIILYCMYLKIEEENYNNMQTTLENNEIKNMKVHLTELSTIYEENNKIRHDLKNMLLLLDKQSKDIEILDEIKERTYSLPMLFTNNDTLNNIINTKMLTNKTKQIDWQFYIESDLKKINRLDLAILLGNLLDNAIENLGHQNKILIQTKHIDNFYFICIKNSVDIPVLKNNETLESYKKDKKRHGIGIRSVNQIVQQYHGDIKFYDENNYFVVEILIKL